MNEIPAFRVWKQQEINKHITTLILTIATSGIAGFILYFSILETRKIPEILLLAATLCGLIAIIIHEFYLIFSKDYWKVRYVWPGIITNLHRNITSTKSVKEYRMIVNANGKEIEGICSYKVYHTAQEGQDAILFTIKGNTIYSIIAKF